MVSAGKAHALDASFQPRGTAVLKCTGNNPKKKIITSFENNAPTGSTVFFMEGESSPGGTTFGKDVKVGDSFSNTPELFWSIKDVQLGPWPVTINIDASCPAEAAKSTNSKKNNLVYLIPAGIILLAVGVLAGRFSRK